MLRWTSSFPFPLNGKTAWIKCVTKVGNVVWILTEVEEDVFQFQLFDTETETFTTIDTKLEFKNIAPMSSSHSGNFIYVWFQDDNVVLYKMDMTNMEWTKCMRLPVFYYRCSKSLIMNNKMYILEDAMLIIIHLSTYKFIRHELKNTLDGAKRVLKTNEVKLYLFEEMSKTRIVSLIENEELVRLSIDDYQDGERVNHIWDEICTAGRMFYKSTDMENLLYLDTFDFKTCKWNRAKLYDKFNLHSSFPFVEVDDKIYFIVRFFETNSFKNELRVLDTAANLLTICFSDLVEELREGQSLEEIKTARNQIPILLRSKFDSFINWRIVEEDDDEMEEEEAQAPIENEELDDEVPAKRFKKC